MSLLFNMLSRFVIAFLPRSNHLLILWLQSPSAVILEPKKIELMTDSDGYLYPRVHSNIIHTSPKVETIQVFINQWMNKHNVLCLYTGILFGHKKKVRSSTCWNVDEPQNYYAKWGKPVTKGQMVYDSSYMKHTEQADSYRQSRTEVARGCGVRGVGSCCWVRTELLWGDGKDLERAVVVTIQWM